MKEMPVLFVGHGSPMNVVENNRFTQGWAEIAGRMPTPDAILCVSAHWYLDGTAVSGAETPETIHDFYGFPPELYNVEYPAPGAPRLAQKVTGLLEDIAQDDARGLDHGAWSVLRFMFPDVDVPVCQLSVNSRNSPLKNYRLGQRLRPLRKEGVLILGSGNIVHNLQKVAWNMPDGGYPWADEFDDYIKQAILEKNHDAVIGYEMAGPAARQAFVYRDHYDPLLYVLGASGTDNPVVVFNEGRVLGSLSMTSYLIG